MSKVEKIKAEIERLKNELSYNKERLNLREIIAVNNCYNNLILFINSLEEEPVSNDLEEESKKYSSCIYLEEVLSDGDKEVLKERLVNTFKAGAKWGTRQVEAKIQAQSMTLAHGCPKEFVSNNLEEAAHSYVDTTIEYFDSEGNPCCYSAFIAGAQWQKERILNNAIEREVKVDAGGYPYIDVTELYDYDKDRPLAKESDKVKLIIIMEE